MTARRRLLSNGLVWLMVVLGLMTWEDGLGRLNTVSLVIATLILLGGCYLVALAVFPDRGERR